MPFTPFAPPLAPVAATPLAGFALVNGTPTILTWTAPNDGANHRFLVFGTLRVTTAETGGQVNVAFTDPGGTGANIQLAGGGQTAGAKAMNATGYMIQPGTTVTIAQNTALTGGAATLWAEIWAA